MASIWALFCALTSASGNSGAPPPAPRRRGTTPAPARRLSCVECVAVPGAAAVTALRDASSPHHEDEFWFSPRHLFERERAMAQRMVAEMGVDFATAEYVIRDVTIGRSYSFLMDGYVPRHLYW